MFHSDAQTLNMPRSLNAGRWGQHAVRNSLDPFCHISLQEKAAVSAALMQAQASIARAATFYLGSAANERSKFGARMSPCMLPGSFHYHKMPKDTKQQRIHCLTQDARSICSWQLRDGVLVQLQTNQRRPHFEVCHANALALKRGSRSL